MNSLPLALNLASDLWKNSKGVQALEILEDYSRGEGFKTLNPVEKAQLAQRLNIYGNRSLAAMIFECSIPLLDKYNQFWSLTEYSWTLFSLGRIEEANAIFRRTRSKEFESEFIKFSSPNHNDSWFEPYRNGLLDLDTDVKGKRIYIFLEGGIGDTIQHIRYAQNLQDEGASEIYIAAQQPIISLLENSGLPIISAHGRARTEIDYVTFPMHLYARYCCKKRLSEKEKPYIKIPKKSGRPKKKSIAEGLRIGIIWKSDNFNRAEPYRSMQLNDFIPIARYFKNARLLSLQVGDITNEERSLINQYKIEDISTKINNFMDTAHIMSKDLDILLTVDSAPLHLAGALGIEALGFIPVNSDWRWFNSAGSTPHYPSVKLLKQNVLGDWHSCIESAIKFIEEI